jgi:hypothetical protein
MPSTVGAIAASWSYSSSTRSWLPRIRSGSSAAIASMRSPSSEPMFVTPARRGSR